MAGNNDRRFDDLTFEGFRQLARDDSLSPHERIGFPDAYRGGKGPAILQDIQQKLTNLSAEGQTVLDVGPGCGELAQLLIALCERQGHRLILVDSAEMLDRLPALPFITKIPAAYPAECRAELAELQATVDVLLVYSVFQYIFREASAFDFLDTSLELLAPGGQLLIGDIPNSSQRNRFLSSAAGIRYHQQFTGSDSLPPVRVNTLLAGQIDDAVVFSLVQRSRNFGFHGYIVPQAADLPMANRREDVLILRP